ncbi:MAG: fibrobacter succinogenes major paralogous domain-containing protein, partial [Bacteroidales bacterium]|nr:fibrobacter succinogenes major paralogous domain-containing protein [Bacteroidales bacterium]
VAVNSGTGQIESGSVGYGQFILRNDATAGSVYDWRDYTAIKWADAYDPCRSLSLGDGKNWRLPTSGEWGLIYANNYPQNTGFGVRFRPDGSNASVFLPAAGSRNRTNGTLSNVSMGGTYWSSSANGGSAFYLNFNSSTVSPASTGARSHGFSVRCVSE